MSSKRSSRWHCWLPISFRMPTMGLSSITFCSVTSSNLSWVVWRFGGGKGQPRLMNLFQVEVPCKIPAVSGFALASSKMEGGLRKGSRLSTSSGVFQNFFSASFPDTGMFLFVLLSEFSQDWQFKLTPSRLQSAELLLSLSSSTAVPAVQPASSGREKSGLRSNLLGEPDYAESWLRSWLASLSEGVWCHKY